MFRCPHCGKGYNELTQNEIKRNSDMHKFASKIGNRAFYLLSRIGVQSEEEFNSKVEYVVVKHGKMCIKFYNNVFYWISGRKTTETFKKIYPEKFKPRKCNGCSIEIENYPIYRNVCDKCASNKTLLGYVNIALKEGVCAADKMQSLRQTPS